MAPLQSTRALMATVLLTACLASWGCSGDATGGSQAAAGHEPSGGSSGSTSAGGTSPVAGAASGGIGHAGAENDGNGGAGASSAGASSGGASSGGASVGGSNAGGSAGAAGSGNSACPATAPQLNDACSDGADCSFGDSPFPECRTHLVCFNGKWAKGFGTTSCSPTPESSCPAAAPMNSADCTGNLGARCAFASGALCTCVSEACGGTGCTALPFPQWTCGQVRPTCPALAPNAGTPCDATMSCEYEYCGLTASCQNGTWKWLFGCA